MRESTYESSHGSGHASNRPPTALVVGAGVFGLTASIELARRGHAVTVTDPGPVPHPDAASTDLSKIVRADYGSDVFYARLADAALEGWARWNREWAWKPFHNTGFLLLAREPLESAGFEGESFRCLSRLGHRLERLDAPALKAAHPAWTFGDVPEGYLSSRAGWAESGRVVQTLARTAAAGGVAIRAGARVVEFTSQESRISGVALEDGTRLRADRVIVAAGSWTPALLPWLGDRMWATGQPVFHFRPSSPEAFLPPRFVPWSADIANTGWYGFPLHPSGVVKIANHGPGHRLEPNAPRVVPDGWDDRFRSFLRQEIPELADAPIVQRRVCVYCDTFDNDFWIDHDPDRPGLIVAAGGSGHGFKFAPVLGGIIADVVEGRDNPWAHRFRWRQLGTRRVEPARGS
jgi:glycine/D-amino acid oxidase-like deaminating enzyme